jgi:hypothetical protein
MVIPLVESKKVKSNFPFSFFSKVLFISFWKFGFLKNAKDGKLNMPRKRRKLKWQIFGEGENQKMQMVEERQKKSNMR